MSHSPPSPQIAELLADSRWMRALARRLVGEAGAVEELVQDACVAALERPERASRAWLAGAMRNLARLRRRAGTRRRARELATAERPAVPTPAELCSRLDSQRRLAEAVLALREPYREAILLRFSAELEPKEIGAHLGVPSATVRSRLKRGLELLREELDATYGGDGRAWCVALLPLASMGARRDATSALEPASRVHALALAGGVAAFTCIGALIASMRPARDVELEPSARIERAASEAVLAVELGPERSVLRAEPRAGEADAAPRAVFRGLVVDAQGEPLARVGVRLCAERWTIPAPGGEALVRTDAQGAFEISAALARDGLGSSGLWAIAEPEWTTLQASSHEPQLAERELLVVAARPRAVEGVVVDELGAPIEGAQVMHDLPLDFRARFPLPLDAANEIARRARTDALGRFAFPALPDVTGAFISARAPGRPIGRVALAAQAAKHVRIELARASLDEGAALVGRVLDARGEPAAGARVGDGRRAVTCDAQGGFRLPRIDGVLGERLLAARDGCQPASIELDAARDELDAIELRLTSPALALRLCIVDARGEPVAGARVLLADPTPLGRELDGDPLYVEEQAGEGAAAGALVSDAHGRIELPGLAARPYRLLAFAADGRRAELDALAPGANEELVLLADDPTRTVRGRLRRPDGAPVAHASVWLERELLLLPRIPGDLGAGESASSPTREALNASRFVVRRSGERTVSAFGPEGDALRVRVCEPVRSDAMGRFVLEGAHACEGLRVVVFDPRSVPVEEPLAPTVHELELVVPRRAHVQFVQSTSAPRFDRFRLEDAQGRALSLWSTYGERIREHPFTLLVGERTDLVAAPETAARYVLMLGNEEVGDGPLTLEPGTVTRMRP